MTDHGLREAYRRLATAARAVCEDARQHGRDDEAMVAAHHLRRLIREIEGTPQPDGLALVR
jgi:hypothetical protein